jgi:hypothetical protein
MAEIRLREIVITSILIVGGILTILYLFGIIEVAILENRPFKIATTVLLLAGIAWCAVYYSHLPLPIVRKHGFTLAALIVEVLGYWWLESWLGYVLIIIGAVFLVMGLIKEGWALKG